MSSDPPVDFQTLAQGARGSSSSDYPFSIKATDLMKNFVFATTVFADGMTEDVGGIRGHTQRRLRIAAGRDLGDLAYWDGSNWTPLARPLGSSQSVLIYSGNVPQWITAPGGNTKVVLGATNGQIEWIETENCDS